MSFNKKIIAKNFSRGAQKYDEAALIQAKSSQELVALASPFVEKNSLILDLGSGTSFVAKQLLEKVADDKKIKIFELDIAFDMLNSWRNRPENIFPIQGDIENLPFKKNSFDLVISSFALHWVSDFEKIFAQIFSLLKPNGIFAFCLPTDQSLHELKAPQTFQINAFPLSDDLSSILKKIGFSEKKFEKKIVKQNFENGSEALKSLKKIGANYSANSQKIISKNTLAQFNKFCLKNFGDIHKNFTTSWEISFFISTKNDR